MNRNNRPPLLALLLALTITGAACNGEGTTGYPVVLHTRLQTNLTADNTFITSPGWTITLTAAALATGPFYYYDGQPAFSTRTRWRRTLQVLSPVGTAWAHPGHYVEGDAHGEMLSPFSVDLLAGPATLPDGDGITGLVRSATFSFAPTSTGPAASALGGHAASAQGTATKDGTTVNFLFTADFADITRSSKDGKVGGCAFAEVDIRTNGTVTITINPRSWFNLVDFTLVDAGNPDAPTVPAPGSTPYTAFLLGLSQLSAYQFSYTAD